MTPEPLLTVEQVAEWLAVKPSTVRAYAEKRKLPHFRIGGRLRFSPDAIAGWLAEREVRPRRKGIAALPSPVRHSCA